MELRELYNKMISEGFNHFYIEGIGGPVFDDVECLGKIGSEWAVYYVERGQKSSPMFTSSSIDEAMEERRKTLENQNMRVIQNDIPHYSKTHDRVYRLFVVNKDIFKAKKLFDVIPLYDDDLKR